MKRDSMSKLSAGLFVLVLVLSGLVIVPGGLPAQASSTTNIYVPVLSGGSPVTDADVTLTDVHTGAQIAADYSSVWTAYMVTGAPSGYYRVDVTHDDYYDALDSAEFRYVGDDNYTTDIVYLTGFPNKQYTWNVTVRNPSNQVVPGATVGFYNPVVNEWVAHGVTNSAGYVVIYMFESLVVGDVDLVVVANNYQTYVEPVAVSSNNNTAAVKLAAPMVVSSYIKAGSNPAVGAVSYLINTDPAVPWVKRVLKSTSSAMRFDAYPGNFILVVDADGCQADVRSLTVAGDTPLTIVLNPQVPQDETVSMAFGSDFASFGLTVNTNWSFDMAYPGLPYADMGSLRTQVDLVLGNGDGTVSSDEALAFHDQLLNWGTEYVASERLLTINGTAFVSEAALNPAAFIMDLAAGDDTVTTSVQYAYACSYSATDIELDVSEYAAVAHANYDTSEVDYEYSMALVSGYERVSNSSGSFDIEGYTTVVVDPMKVSGGPVAISIGIETSKEPVARGAVQSSSVAYPVENETGVVTSYIVNVSSNVTFTAKDSSDPNGNPLKYTWDFKDGSLAVTTYNATIVHKYTSASALRVVDLTIEDVTGMTDSTVVNVTCDNLDPVPVILVKQGWINETDGALWVNQTDTVILNATDSVDGAVSNGDEKGLIDYFQFDFGDNDSSGRVSWSNPQKNVTHIYKTAGNFTLTLKVTDVVGHSKSTTMAVWVNDTTKPVVGYTVKNLTGGATLVENQTAVFNASDTTDNIDEYQNLTYYWNFGDDTEATEGKGLYNVTHVYQRVGKLTMVLNVTDSEGNKNTLSRVIEITSSPRPKMYFDKVTYDPKNFTAGQSGLIVVNMTNRGNAVAKNIVLNFYIVSDKDGSQKEITGTYKIYNTTTGEEITADGVAIGGKVYVEFRCTFGHQGTYTIRVNGTSDNQLAPSPSYTAGGSQALKVKQPGWVDWALWAGIIAVIVLVPLLLLLRSRMSKREKKGPRREKKGGEEEL